MQLQSERALAALRDFLDVPLDRVITSHLQQSPEAHALNLFRDVALKVPAYADFLKRHGIDHAAIRSFQDFQSLPLTSKAEYLTRYSLRDLCRGGRLETCDLIAVSSGSTGTPSFWPRYVSDEYPIARRFEQVFVDSFTAASKRTLAVVCFALGTWVGGLYTAACCRHLAVKGFPITVIAPGNNKDEIFRVVTALGEQFEQVVLLGYPPFIKDVIDTGVAHGLDWRRYHIKLVFAGEVFSEEWRSLVGERSGSTNALCDSASLYGTADAGVLGNETPLSIAIRRFFAEHPDAARQCFGESRLPTLVQYDPLSRFFETRDGTLLFTGDNGIPLIRYHISDEGGLLSYADMLGFLRDWRFDPLVELGRYGTIRARELPFVFVFGRSHFVISYFGANVYPENVSVGLEQVGIRERVTGKFVLQSLEDADRNRYLSLIVELAPALAPGGLSEDAVADAVVAQLRRLNSEFAHYVPTEFQRPRVQFRPSGDPEWFPPGVKHRYTRA